MTTQKANREKGGDSNGSPGKATGGLLILVAAGLLALFPFCSRGDQRIGQPVIANSPALAATGGRRILVVVSAHEALGKTNKKTGYWLSEVTHFYHVLARHGIGMDFVSPGGRPAVMDPDSFNLDDGLNRSFWESPALRNQISRPLAPETINPGRYAAIYYAGGHGTMWDFPRDLALAQLAARVYEGGGIVSAVCHGPAGLLNIKLADGSHLLKGKRVTGFANIEETLVLKRSIVPYLLEEALDKAGGLYSRAFLPFASHVVTDGRLVTGQNPGSAAGVAEAVVDVLRKR